jgi:hypothetical protein
MRAGQRIKKKNYKQWTLFAGLPQYTNKPTASPDQNSNFQRKKFESERKSHHNKSKKKLEID